MPNFALIWFHYSYSEHCWCPCWNRGQVICWTQITTGCTAHLDPCIRGVRGRGAGADPGGPGADPDPVGVPVWAWGAPDPASCPCHACHVCRVSPSSVRGSHCGFTVRDKVTGACGPVSWWAVHQADAAPTITWIILGPGIARQYPESARSGRGRVSARSQWASLTPAAVPGPGPVSLVSAFVPVAVSSVGGVRLEMEWGPGAVWAALVLTSNHR